MNVNANMANREVCNLIFEDYKTKSPFLNLDYANVTTTEITGETTFAYGGQGHPKRVAFSGEKGGTLTIETQIQTAKLWQLITGGDVTKSAKYVVRKEMVTADGSVVTLEDTPAAGTVMVFKADDDCGTPVSSSVSGKDITLTPSLNANDSVVVYYTKEVTDNVTRINVKSTSFPNAFTVYGETVMRTEDDDILPYRIIAYKCVPQSNLSLSYSNNGDPGAITITCDLMADRDDNILDLILEEEE